MKGVVLCGGQSLRMGKDKGLLIGSKKNTWAQQAFILLSKLNIEVAFSVNEHQLPFYKQMLTSHKLITDNAALNIMGPLSGILSAHLEYPKEDILVLACDMIEMKFEVLNFLYHNYRQQQNYDAYVFKENNTTEPLCGIYTSGGLKKIVEKNKKNQLEKHSLKYTLGQMNVLYLPIIPDWKKYFSNMNNVSDLQGT